MKFYSSFKTMLSFVLSLVVAFSAIGTSVFASEKQSGTEVQTFNQSRELHTSDGDLLGTVQETTIIERKEIKGSVEYILRQNKDYTLVSPYAEIPAYQTKFQDGSKMTNYSLKDGNKLYRNGNLVKDPTATSIKLNSAGGIQTLSDTGGLPGLCHYYDASDWYNYHFACYEDMDYTGHYYGVAAGGNVQKDTTAAHYMFATAKAEVDAFENYYNDFRMHHLATEALAGIAVITWVNLLAFIGTGAGVAYEALQTVNSWNDADDAINDAYHYIEQF